MNKIYPLKGRDENGAVLVISLIMMVFFSLLGIASILTSSVDTKISGNYRTGVDALYITDAGIERAKAVLKTMAFDDALNGADNDKDTTADNGILSFGSSVSFAGGSYAVQVTDNDDGDGQAWDDSDSMVIITSTGTASNGSQKKIEAMVRRADLDDFPAAISFPDPNVRLEFLSNALSVTGTDTTYSPGPPERAIDVPGTATDKNAIVTEATAPNTNIAYSPANAQDNITGSGGTPDIDLENTTLSLTSLQAARSYLLGLSGITTYTGSTTLTGVTLGTRQSPQITYVNDALTLQGNVSGAGILIVDKDLVISGDFTFEGIVLVGVCPTCPGRLETGTGNSKIFGAMVVANPTSSHSNEARLKMQGNCDIYYSSYGINNVLSATFSSLSWRQVL